jgi:hypothetical protein
MEQLILVLSRDSFNVEEVEKSFVSPVTRQEVSDKLSKITTYKEPNDIFGSFHAQLLTQEEFIEQLNFNNIEVEYSFFIQIEVI